MLAFLSVPSFLKFRLSKSFSLLFQKSDSFQIRNPQKVKFKIQKKTHPQLQKLLLFTFCLMRLTPFRYDFNRERFFISRRGALRSKLIQIFILYQQKASSNRLLLNVLPRRDFHRGRPFQKTKREKLRNSSNSFFSKIPILCKYGVSLVPF